MRVAQLRTELSSIHETISPGYCSWIENSNDPRETEDLPSHVTVADLLNKGYKIVSVSNHPDTYLTTWCLVKE